MDADETLMMERLVRIDRQVLAGQLARDTAHEVNNALGLILGYVQLLLRDKNEGAQLRQDLGIIEKHARLCKSLLSASARFSPGVPAERNAWHLHELLEKILALLEHSMERSAIVAEKDWDPRVPFMDLDGEGMGQVFLNLLMNAVQAIGSHGSVRITTEYDRGEHKVLVRIGDDGCGMNPEEQSRIFDLFFTSKEGEGTGLGLSVSRHIVEKHGGRILVDSLPGRGSTFTVLLPVNSGEKQKGPS